MLIRRGLYLSTPLEKRITKEEHSYFANEQVNQISRASDNIAHAVGKVLS